MDTLVFIISLSKLMIIIGKIAMKNFIKMGVLGLALSFSITACKYEKPEDFLRVNDNQTSVGLVLGDSHISYIYNMKKPQDIFIYAPT